MNAMAQQILGGGTESSSYSDFVELVHLNIDNIHAVRKSFQQIFSLVKEQPPCSKWHAAVESTNWLKHIRTILRGARHVSQELRRGRSCLVHCSDGWDRTPQVCALAELMMDCYYRTIQGFIVLIQREFMSFGHRFRQRVGVANSNHKDSQRSPVFQQFLDCVWQLTVMYPKRFEFNERFLIFISDHVVSARFSTFLFNSEKEHTNVDRCFWTYLKTSKKKRFLNKAFREDPTIMIPSHGAISTQIRLWDTYFLRWLPGILPEHVLDEDDEEKNRRTSLKRLSRRLMQQQHEEEKEEDKTLLIENTILTPSTPKKIIDSRAEKYGVEWEADEDRKECSICRAEFHLLRRRHHCRKCGQIVCNACSKWRERVTTSDGEVKKGKRVCDHCRG